MVETKGRAHDAATSSGIAKALQHSGDTARLYYRLPDTSKALRRMDDIQKVDHTAMVEAYIDKQ